VSTLHERLLRRLDGQRLSAPKLCAAVRAVVELHAPSPVQYERRLGCQGCESDGDFGPQDWPCETVKIIATSLGVEIGETPK
jgi:hypothetical protein